MAVAYSHFSSNSICLVLNWQKMLNVCCRQGHLDIVKYVAAEAGCDLNSSDTNGYTPLFTACR